jgi:two-component system, cell cycle sensor histidine kinase and response regulator CckA
MSDKPAILLVDDTESLRKLAALVLTRAGHHIVQAEDGESALLKAKERGRPFDLLVTDLTMPGLGGRELAAELRKLHPALKVVFMSGSEEAADLTMMADGVRTWWLSKPFNPEDLIGMARASLAVPP